MVKVQFTIHQAWNTEATGKTDNGMEPEKNTTKKEGIVLENTNTVNEKAISYIKILEVPRPVKNGMMANTQ